jgi:hypothetical protein
MSSTIVAMPGTNSLTSHGALFPSVCPIGHTGSDQWEVVLSGGPRQSYWLLVERTDVSVCLKNPGFDIDVIVSADIVAYYRVWLGRVTLSEALRKQQVKLDGTPADVRAFSGWFAWSPMAGAVRAALADHQPIKLGKKNAG